MTRHTCNVAGEAGGIVQKSGAICREDRQLSALDRPNNHDEDGRADHSTDHPEDYETRKLHVAELSIWD